MEVFPFDDGFWIIGPDLEIECGPYDTEAEAEDDRKGMQNFLDHCDEPGYYMSVDEERKGSLK